ncbi:MAG TPA: response regulator transcription factor [Lacipirellulaceae bacterium]|jgi:DNA-binding response OmpR family regulator|nr:response regulator transcription factor [Lacipirellulaceae bacterium]
MEPLILIVEDDRKTSSLLAAYLAREGYRTVAAYDGEQALKLFGSAQPQLLILDIMLPLLDGWEVCREIRKSSTVPVLFLTARDEESDRVLGLSLGGDDYVVKPFSPREVVARVKAILRRVGQAPETTDGTVTHGPLVLDTGKRRVSRNGDPVLLTPLEFALLKTLMLAPGRIFMRDELLSHLYPRGESVVDRVVDVHIGKLRQKIEDDPAHPELIITARGTGYRFADRTSQASL